MQWSMRFPADEEVKAVAIGSGWAAAATNQHFLRVFTEAGLQVKVQPYFSCILQCLGEDNIMVEGLSQMVYACLLHSFSEVKNPLLFVALLYA